MTALDTIVALATPRAVGALAVVRLSGAQSLAVLKHLVKRPQIKPNEAFFATLYADKENEITALDQAVVTFYQGPHSYTGEDTVEFSLHGSPLVADAIIDACLAYGARSARPGEFTLKAYLNGKMSLLAAEGVDDFIKAQSTAGQKLAWAAMQGASAESVGKLKDALLSAVAEAEYILEDDLSEHGDYLAEMTKVAAEKVVPVLTFCQKLQLQALNARRLYAGIKVALVGQPNAGKSSLLNALLGEDKAIVTNVPGTTRDIVEGSKEIGGVLFKFMDTAGLRPTQDTVEKIGVDKAWQALRAADIVILVSDQPFNALDGDILPLLKDKKVLKVGSKNDLLKVGDADVTTSAKNKDIKALEAALVTMAAIEETKNEVSFMSERDIDFLGKLIVAIEAALKALREDGYVDAFSDMLRRGIDQVNELLGTDKSRTGAEIYDTVFAHFCLGK